jgi:lipopolysaccharide biosynthesis glycosyltransferase
MKNDIALLIALNDSFVLSAKVFLYSLLQTNKWFNLPVYFLSDGNLSKESINSLRKIYSKIVVLEAKKQDYLNCLPTTQTWGYNLYYRFDVFEMNNLGHDRIIIFDSDMVFLKDISELLEYNHDFCACEKYLNIPEIFSENPAEQKRKRFNCGLMSISKNIIKKEIKEDLIKIAESKSWSSDQPVFNLYFADKIVYLPQTYNVVSSIATFDNLKSAHILQYHGFVKPWHSSNHLECFEDSVKNEIIKNSKTLISITTKLKNTFDSYVEQVKHL